MPCHVPGDIDERTEGVCVETGKQMPSEQDRNKFVCVTSDDDQEWEAVQLFASQGMMPEEFDVHKMLSDIARCPT